jgi:hypothetical protein
MKAQVPSVVRPCQPLDFEAMYAIVNDAAQAYRGVIPTDRWHDPYMPSEQSARLRKTVCCGPTGPSPNDKSRLRSCCSTNLLAVTTAHA